MGDPYSHNESTLQSVLLKARNIGHTLQETDLFHNVNATLEPTRDVTAPVRDVDLVFKTKERGRLQLKTSTEFGNQEGSAVRGIRNYYGLISAFTFLLERGGPPAQCLRRRGGPRRPIVLWHTNKEVFSRCTDSPAQSHTLNAWRSVDFRNGA